MSKVEEDVVERVVPDTESWDQFGLEHEQRYQFFSSYVKNKKVLDAACGTGYGSSLLHLLGGAKSVLGIDVSPEALDYAKRYLATHVSFKNHDCMKIDQLNEKFDVVISFETIEHLSQPEEFIFKVCSVLEPGGIFICSTPNKERLSGAGNINPFHPSELSFHEFESAFEKYFNISGIYHQSETVQYSRYLELKHNNSKVGGRSAAYFFNRIENKIRKLLGKDFVYDPYIRKDLENMFEGDMEILPLKKGPLSWHKTFILTGIRK
ncbi:MAG: class I SAM-dependent methyltransferase [Bacteroidota bacterium]|jgi:SAM-dependent methyltransferase